MKKWAFLAIALVGLTSIGCTEEKKPATTTTPATGTTPAADPDDADDAPADAS